MTNPSPQPIPAPAAPAEPQLRMLLTIRPPLPVEQAEKRRLLQRFPSLALLSVWITVAFYAVSTLFYMEGASLIVWMPLIATGVLLCLLAKAIEDRRRDRRDEAEYRTALASEPRERCMKVYDDRIEVVGAQGTSVYPFARVTRMVCTRMLLVLCMPGEELVLRAEDMTPFDADLLLTLLRVQLPAGAAVRIRKPLAGRLVRPLPLPPPPRASAPLMIASVPDGGEPEPKDTRRLWMIGSAILLAMVVLTGCSFVGIPVLDFLLAFAGVLLTEWLLWRLIRKAAGPQPARDRTFVLTPDGLVRIQNGVIRFCRRDLLRVTKCENGVQLAYPAGKTFVRWEQMTDSDAARQLLG